MSPFRDWTMATVAIAAAASVLASSCAFSMQSGFYREAEQEDGFTLVYAVPVTSSLSTDDVDIARGVLDGASALGGSSLVAAVEFTVGGQTAVYHIDEAAASAAGSASHATVARDYLGGFLSVGSTTVDRVSYFAGTGYTSGLFCSTADLLTASGDTAFHGFAWNRDWSAGGNGSYRALSSDGADATVAVYADAGAFTPATASSTIGYASAVETVNAAYATLVTPASGAGLFWNGDVTTVDAFGFSVPGAFSWLEATRREALLDAEERVLCVLSDSGGAKAAPIAGRAAGTAGSLVVVRLDSDGNYYDDYEFYDATLARKATLRVHGDDSAYLGEAAVGGESVVVFGVLTLGFAAQNAGAAWLTLYAYPASALGGGS